jgi:hypothetical protein
MKELDLRNIKVRVKNPTESHRVQRLLISKGIAWHDGADIKNTGNSYLIVDDGCLSTCSTTKFFEDQPEEEALLVTTTTYSLEPLKKLETVLLNGVSYLKTDLEEALKNLTPIKEINNE